MLFYHTSRLIHRLGWGYGGRIISGAARLIFGCWIPGTATIGRGVVFGYWGLGIVVHNDAKIGHRCHICQNVTIGRNANKSGVPILDDDVYVGAGAVILGEIVIGSGAVVGANSVVTRSVFPGEIVAGAPARVIGKVE